MYRLILWPSQVTTGCNSRITVIGAVEHKGRLRFRRAPLQKFKWSLFSKLFCKSTWLPFFLKMKWTQQACKWSKIKLFRSDFLKIFALRNPSHFKKKLWRTPPQKSFCPHVLCLWTFVTLKIKFDALYAFVDYFSNHVKITRFNTLRINSSKVFFMKMLFFIKKKK